MVLKTLINCYWAHESIPTAYTISSPDSVGVYLLLVLLVGFPEYGFNFEIVRNWFHSDFPFFLVTLEFSDGENLESVRRRPQITLHGVALGHDSASFSFRETLEKTPTVFCHRPNT